MANTADSTIRKMVSITITTSKDYAHRLGRLFARGKPERKANIYIYISLIDKKVNACYAINR
jgi:hypothetical protein